MGLFRVGAVAAVGTVAGCGYCGTLGDRRDCGRLWVRVLWGLEMGHPLEMTMALLFFPQSPTLNSGFDLATGSRDGGN